MSLKSALWVRPVMAVLLGFPAVGFAADAPPPPADWIPAGVEQLGRTAAFHTDFTFDRTMLQLAGGLMDGGDADTRNAIAKLDGVTVHLYRYAAPGMYDPRQLDGIREQYRQAGWKHLVSTSTHPAAADPNAAPLPGSGPIDMSGHTDLFLRFQGADVTGMVVVQAGVRNLNVIALTGDLSPIDLLHLRGHFGIPRFAGDGFAPANN